MATDSNEKSIPQAELEAPKQEIATPEPEVDVNQLSDSEVEAEIERL